RGTAQRTRASGPVTAPRPAIEPLGECAVLVRFGTAIDPAVNARVHAAARAIAAARLAGVADIVPAYASLAVHYDPRAWQGAATQALPWRRLAARLADLVRAHADPSTDPARRIEIPVRYGGADGPGLALVARHAGLDSAACGASTAACENRGVMCRIG